MPKIPVDPPAYDRGFHNGVKTLSQAIYRELFPDSPHNPEAGSDAMILATRAWVRFAILPLKDKHPAGSPPIKPSQVPPTRIPQNSKYPAPDLQKHPLQHLILSRYRQLASNPRSPTPTPQTISDSLSIEGVRDFPLSGPLPHPPSLTSFRHLSQKARLALCLRILET